MSPSELLEEFRSLGGIASNIEIRESTFGRGLFVIDSAQEATIFVPERLLVPSDWLELDNEEHARLEKNCAIGIKHKQFFEHYQRALGWDRTKEAFHARQLQISALPERIKVLLGKTGWTDKDLAPPTLSGILQKFKHSRWLKYKGKHVLMPMLELANHDAGFKSFELKQGVGISGKFTGQVLVNYATGLDPIGMFRTYGFSELTEQVMSCPMELGNPSFGKIIISRAPSEAIMSGGTRIPKIRRDGNQYYLSYLPIGDMLEPMRPRKIFGQLMGEIGLAPSVVELLFNRIVSENRKLCNELLAELGSIQGDLHEGMRRMLHHQLHPIK